MYGPFLHMPQAKIAGQLLAAARDGKIATVRELLAKACTDPNASIDEVRNRILALGGRGVGGGGGGGGVLL